MKTIAFYLPQYHSFPENDEWWGEGFTEWTNLKKAEPLYDGHYQPRVPLDNNYYNLLENKNMEWQCEIAKKYGVYGFCFYHYWFDGHMLMEKPMEKFLNNPNCDMNFCICWANENWTKAWVNKEDTVLIGQTYGDEKQWIKHFEYFLPFFKDSRYILEDNKPFLVIYRPELIPCLDQMLECWNKLAEENGFDGIKYLYQHVSYDNVKKKDERKFDYAIEYQPAYALRDMDSKFIQILKNFKRRVNTVFEKNFNLSLDLQKLKTENMGPNKVSYDKAWETILKRMPPNDTYIPGAFVDWDNTPRRGNTGRVFVGASPQKFEKYFKLLVKKAKEEYKKDMIFIFAWNEWTEGGYLEPDEKFKFGYLEAIKKVLEECGELPQI